MHDSDNFYFLRETDIIFKNIIKQNRQCTDNVRVMRVPATTVVVAE